MPRLASPRLLLEAKVLLTLALAAAAAAAPRRAVASSFDESNYIQQALLPTSFYAHLTHFSLF